MAMHPEVTGSCILVIVKLPTRETIRFVVDCGLFQEKDYEELNENLAFDAENIDFILVTHNKDLAFQLSLVYEMIRLIH